MSEGHANKAQAHDVAAQTNGHEVTAEALGEPDLQAWSAALVGGGVGLLVALAMFVATQS
jgi:hypothetical protein